jgi:soluble lytic murein transglycosylase-like protein
MALGAVTAFLLAMCVTTGEASLPKNKEGSIIQLFIRAQRQERPVRLKAAPFSRGSEISRGSENVPELLLEAARRCGLPIGLLAHRAWMESRFEAGAEDGRGCHGVMQLNERSFPGAAEMTAEANIAAGARYLAKLYRECEKKESEVRSQESEEAVGVCAERAYRTGRVRR